MWGGRLGAPVGGEFALLFTDVVPGRRQPGDSFVQTWRSVGEDSALRWEKRGRSGQMRIRSLV